MTTPRILLTLALLSGLSAAPGCDVEVKKTSASEVGDSQGDTEAGTEGTDSEGTSGSTSGATEGATEGDSEGGSSSSTTDVPPPPPPDPKPSQVILCEGEPYEGNACTTPDGVAGHSYCIVVDGAEVETPCYPPDSLPCDPNFGFDEGCLGEICAWNGEDLYDYSWEEPDCNTPLVVNLEGAPLRFDAVGAAAFDLAGANGCVASDWPALPWLALDRDGDGAITSGRELFGSGTRLADGRRAAGGFEALAELDADRDGKITVADPVFAELVLWTDHDGDRRGELVELTPVREASLVAIDLEFASRVECDARGNCGRERARLEFRAATGEIRSGEVVDVYLACQ